MSLDIPMPTPRTARSGQGARFLRVRDLEREAEARDLEGALLERED